MRRAFGLRLPSSSLGVATALSTVKPIDPIVDDLSIIWEEVVPWPPPLPLPKSSPLRRTCPHPTQRSTTDSTEFDGAALPAKATSLLRRARALLLQERAGAGDTAAVVAVASLAAAYLTFLGGRVLFLDNELQRGRRTRVECFEQNRVLCTLCNQVWARVARQDTEAQMLPELAKVLYELAVDSPASDASAAASGEEVTRVADAAAFPAICAASQGIHNTLRFTASLQHFVNQSIDAALRLVVVATGLVALRTPATGTFTSTASAAVPRSATPSSAHAGRARSALLDACLTCPDAFANVVTVRLAASVLSRLRSEETSPLTPQECLRIGAARASFGAALCENSTTLLRTERITSTEFSAPSVNTFDVLHDELLEGLRDITNSTKDERVSAVEELPALIIAASRAVAVTRIIAVRQATVGRPEEEMSGDEITKVVEQRRPKVSAELHPLVAAVLAAHHRAAQAAGNTPWSSVAQLTWARHGLGRGSSSDVFKAARLATVLAAELSFTATNLVWYPSSTSPTPTPPLVSTRRLLNAAVRLAPVVCTAAVSIDAVVKNVVHRDEAGRRPELRWSRELCWCLDGRGLTDALIYLEYRDDATIQRLLSDTALQMHPDLAVPTSHNAAMSVLSHQTALNRRCSLLAWQALLRNPAASFSSVPPKASV